MGLGTFSNNGVFLTIQAVEETSKIELFMDTEFSQESIKICQFGDLENKVTHSVCQGRVL